MPFEYRISALIAVAAVALWPIGATLADEAAGSHADRLEAARSLEAEGRTSAAADALLGLLDDPEGLDPAVRAAAYSDLARLRLVLGEYTAAMEAAAAAAAQAEEVGDRSAQSNAEFMVGMVHRHLNQLEEATSAFRASARLALDAGDTDQYLRAANEESNILVMVGDLDGALDRKLEAMRDAGESAGPGVLAWLENDLAFVYSRLDRHAEAFPHYERAWQLNLELGQRREAAIIACNLAGNLAALGDNRLAVTWAERGLAIAEADGLLPAQETAHLVLGEILAASGDAPGAVPHLLEAYELRERTLTEESARRIAELGSRHEAERREAEIALLRRDAEIRELELDRARNLRRLLVGGVATLVAFLAVLAAAYRIKAQANTEIRAANRAIEESRRRVEELSRTDPLTGLANRRALEERLADEALRSERSRRPFAVVLADIDHFKRVNDELGHAVGDEVLRTLASRLRAGVRSLDLAGRWGGEEFLLVLPDTGAEGAVELAEKLRRTIAGEAVEVDGRRVPVHLTFGIAEHREGPIEDTVRRADEALYRGKREGRDRVVVA
ncbi:MAG: diguanylate cyclase [Thermoanaerobaculales bacterium]|jgi:diguanylate cyclase (GGDEF)-like protein|nr:diguanylate cyclase [Thermoanaerobaculales bacterium]